MRIATIGFTKKSAEAFFTAIRAAGVARVVDVRLNNVSQLAGFSKRDDLRYFLRKICHVDYVHEPELAPTQEILGGYRAGKLDWIGYEREFLELMRNRRIEETLPKELIDGACLLCSEERPEHCHRRLVVEYLQEHWGGLEIVHLH